MADKILLRGDSKANWESVNPVLSAKEIVIETDTKKLKIGDGVKTYTQLAYATGGGEVLEYSAQLYQSGTANPVFQSPQTKTIEVSPGGLWDGSNFIPETPVSRQVEALRATVGTYEIYLLYKQSDAKTNVDISKVSLTLGDATAKITSKANGALPSGLNYVMWQIKTYNTSGVLADSLLLGNNGMYVNIRYYQ